MQTINSDQNKFNDQLSITSREIAQITGKRQADVMRDIRILIEQIGDFNERTSAPVESGYMFQLSEYEDGKGQLRPLYILNKKVVLLLTSGYSAVLRAKIIDRMEEKDQQLNSFEFMAAKPTTSRQ